MSAITRQKNAWLDTAAAELARAEAQYHEQRDAAVRRLALRFSRSPHYLASTLDLERRFEVEACGRTKRELRRQLASALRGAMI